MDKYTILLSLASGALGSLLVLILQELRSVVGKTYEDIIGTISLVYKIHSNVNTITTYREGVILTKSKEAKVYRGADTRGELVFSNAKLFEDLIYDPIDMGKQITLKYKSLGCFYTINQVNRSSFTLKRMIQQLELDYQSYIDRHRQLDAFTGHRVDSNKTYLDTLDSNLSIIDRSIKRIQENYLQLLAFAKFSLQEVPWHRFLRKSVFFYARKDIQDIMRVIDKTTQDLVAAQAVYSKSDLNSESDKKIDKKANPMKARNMLAIAILVLGSIAAFYCYTRLAAILPMSNPDAVTKVEAKITAVNTPMVKKGQGTSDVKNNVTFSFSAQGNTIEGGYSMKGRHEAPKVGAAEPVVYLTKHPQVFLREAEYNDLPRQLSALRWMMWIFALVAMIGPFAVMKHGA